MNELKAIVWFIILLISILSVFATMEIRGQIVLFPEGSRWWHFPSQLLSLIVFATVVLNHPFK